MGLLTRKTDDFAKLDGDVAPAAAEPDLFKKIAAEIEAVSLLP